ncbi:hypothetical protein C8J57DRAFT_1255251 [Mycena rebaudengoi]|nr:hypothetical protein C8J57DRAFT_1255251 [Mycena rebaudengoi]
MTKLFKLSCKTRSCAALCLSLQGVIYLDFWFTIQDAQDLLFQQSRLQFTKLSRGDEESQDLPYFSLRGFFEIWRLLSIIPALLEAVEDAGFVPNPPKTYRIIAMYWIEDLSVHYRDSFLNFDLKTYGNL